MEPNTREPALSRKRISLSDMAGQKSKKRHGRIRRSKKLQPPKVEETSGCCSSISGCSSSSSGGGGGEDEKVEVENKVVALRRIVPGGESVDNVDELFEETAGYIRELQYQIEALKFLARFVEEGSHRDLRKFGG